VEGAAVIWQRRTAEERRAALARRERRERTGGRLP